MPIPLFSAGFEHYMHKAMRDNLHDFQGSEEPNDEQARKEIYSNYTRLYLCDYDSQVEIMTRALFPHIYMYGPTYTQAYKEVMWVKENKASEYYYDIVLDGMSIMESLVSDPRKSADTRIKDRISLVTESMATLQCGSPCDSTSLEAVIFVFFCLKIKFL